MNEPVAAPDPLSMRVSQTDRERVSRILNRATNEGRLTTIELAERLDRLGEARTVGELNDLVADLPGHELLSVPPSRAPEPIRPPVQYQEPAPYSARADERADTGFSRIGGAPGPSTAVAVLGGATRDGAWVVPPHFRAIAVMGGVDLDLTSATFAAPEATIEAYALMGGVEITVPPDITVVVNGGAFMGGFSDSVHQQGPPGAPVLHVTGFALMGGVDVGRRRRENN
jgi:hypothetical protein